MPEMEDLYEDICDGCCLCALVSFYAPRNLELSGEKRAGKKIILLI